MNRRSNWEDFKNILEQNHITKLYHFTDRDNLENIIKNGGLILGRIVRNVASIFLNQEVEDQVLHPGRWISVIIWNIMFVSALP